MSYILYGGLFDPVHKGHMEIARAAFKKVKAEKVIWIPSANPPHKNPGSVDAVKRKEMLEWLFRDIDEYEVSAVEISDKHSGYSFETLKIFKEKYAGSKIFFLIGTDEAANFKSWKEWEYILGNSALIIGKRDGVRKKIPDEIKKNAIFLDNTRVDISSSRLRELLIRGKSCKSYLPDKLEEYIRTEKLYS